MKLNLDKNNSEYLNSEDIAIPQPCSENWDAMTGDHQKRFCLTCNKHVHNISTLTKQEYSELSSKDENSICIRFNLVENQIVKNQKNSKLHFKFIQFALGILAFVFSSFRPAKAEKPYLGEMPPSKNPPVQNTNQQLPGPSKVKLGKVALPENSNTIQGRLNVNPPQTMGKPIPKNNGK